MDDGVTISGAPRRPGAARRIPRPAAALPARIDPEIGAILAARHGDPFAYLGMHEEAGRLVVRAMLPGAESVEIVDAGSGEVIAAGELRHPGGFFVARLDDRKERFPYRLRVFW